MRRAVAAVWAAVGIGGLGLPAAAEADRTQRSVFGDDRLLVLSGAAVREQTLDDLALLGADTVHSIVLWHKLAPAPQARRRPAGFDGADPGAYPPEAWDPYDDLVRGATVRGMELLLSPSAPVPSWAAGPGCGTTVALRRTCRPNPTQFRRFVQALGRRYSGAYPDENQGRAPLPRVSLWSVWNEPNQGGWLTPQFERVGGEARPVAPVLYRGLVRAALKGLQASGHGRDEVLLGETAPLGRSSGSLRTRPSAPGDFLRAVLCLDAAGRALRGAAAQALDCSGPFARLRVTGVAHHPYTRGGSRPPTDKGGPAEITISSMGRLAKLVDQAAARGRLPRRLPLWSTEFGFQTNPPDTIFGVPLAKQAEWLNQADWLAFREPRLRSHAQYELRDERDTAAFQTGLRFFDGRPKPGFDAYRLPIWVSRAGSRLRVWGQVRPAGDDAEETVEVQRDADGSGSWETVREVGINRKGFFLTTVARQPGTWRLRWAPADGGPAVVSRVARVAPR
jgi:hypothetical protein